MEVAANDDLGMCIIHTKIGEDQYFWNVKKFSLPHLLLGHWTDCHETSFTEP